MHQDTESRGLNKIPVKISEELIFYKELEDQRLKILA